MQIERERENFLHSKSGLMKGHLEEVGEKQSQQAYHAGTKQGDMDLLVCYKDEHCVETCV